TGVAFWRPFVCDGSSGILWKNCWAYLNTNGANGVFDCTGSQNVRYDNCMAGGNANTSWQSFAAPAPFTSGQNLGNTSALGFNIADSAAFHAVNIALLNCISNTNQRGLQGGTTFGPVRVVGGDFSNNTQIGLNFLGTSNTLVSRVTGGPRVTGNTTTNMQIGGTNYANVLGNVAAPTLPATGVQQNNPFPF